MATLADMHNLWALPSMKQPKLSIERSLQSGKLPPTWLLAGPEGTGKWALGMALTQAMLCERPTPWGCDACPSCRRVRTFSHSGLFLMFPYPTGGGTGKARTQFQQEYSEALLEWKRTEPLWPATRLSGFERRNRFVPVERVTELLNWASLRPSEGTHKVAFLYEPELCVRSVTDKLLKLTEEPPADTTIILISHQGELLPQTIRSRARVVRVARMGAPQLESTLISMGHPAVLSARAARLCRGLLGPALYQLSQPAETDVEEEAFGLLLGLLSGKTATYTTLQEWQWKGAREKVNDVLDVWAMLVRDLACRPFSAAVLTRSHGELAGLLTGLADPIRAEQALSEIRRTQQALDTYVHVGVALSALASRLLAWGQKQQVVPFWAESQFV